MGDGDATSVGELIWPQCRSLPELIVIVPKERYLPAFSGVDHLEFTAGQVINGLAPIVDRDDGKIQQPVVVLVLATKRGENDYQPNRRTAEGFVATHSHIPVPRQLSLRFWLGERLSA